MHAFYREFAYPSSVVVAPGSVGAHMAVDATGTPQTFVAYSEPRSASEPNTLGGDEGPLEQAFSIKREPLIPFIIVTHGFFLAFCLRVSISSLVRS